MSLKHTKRQCGPAIILIGLLGIFYFCVVSPLELSPFNSSYLLLDQPQRTLNVSSSSSKFAIATFIADSQEMITLSGEDYYFTAVRVLAYQLMYANETRCASSIPFLVLVTNTIPEEKRRQLATEGATVIPVEDVPVNWWIKPGIKRWKDQFTKLRLFELEEYDRILFLDADTLVTRPLDNIFNEQVVRIPSKMIPSRTDQIKKDEYPLPPNYVFAARSDNALTGERNHPYPPLSRDYFSAGFWVLAPSRDMLRYLLSVMSHYRRFDPSTMEQSLLNYAFRQEGAMPWKELNYTWSATWPNGLDLRGGVATLHEKFWRTGPEELSDLWWQWRDRMIDFHGAPEHKAAHKIM